MMIYTTGTLVLRRKFSAQLFARDIIDNGCTVLLYSGELCRYLTTIHDDPLDKAHRIRLAIGNGLRPDIWETFQTKYGIPEVATPISFETIAPAKEAIIKTFCYYYFVDRGILCFH
jgi:hypothetical protein